MTLLDEGNTIPFIARYRKEHTGSLDEVQIYDIQQTHHQITQLVERKEEVIRLIGEQDKLTEELQKEIEVATTLQQVEDLYRPYRQKRRTKAMTAIENGLEPLSQWLLEADNSTDEDIQIEAEKYLNDEVETIEQALEGAHEILAQQSSDNAHYREFIRKYTTYNAQLVTRKKKDAEDPQSIYQMYYDFKEKYQNLVEHRILAINRAEKEEVITVRIEVDEEPAISYMVRHFVPKGLSQAKQKIVIEAIADGYRRFIQPAIERELRNLATEKADRQAIEVFGENLRNLLLQPPLKGKVMMGFDPAYRTGCKLAIIDETGRVLTKDVIYPHKPQAKWEEAKEKIKALINRYGVQLIAIGNGTASRESEQFVSEVIKDIDSPVQFMIVDEAGASVYSASKIAREEFPDFEVEERSAVSIARRIQDPLAELIKIDPKSLGVGQYQHDVAQKELSEELDFVVNMTVNQVGVDINTASAQLLQHVSGLSKATANNVIVLRDEIGRFTTRKQIKEVKRLGPKTFEQSVGFLRILNGDNPLDQTNIHPESYPIAEEMLKEVGVTKESLGSKETIAQLEKLDLEMFKQSSQTDLGLDSLNDILEGLKHPAKDIRDARETPMLRDDILTLDDLNEGDQLQGVVRNVVDFGAFVDIGVKQDGLIHISKLSDKFIKHPSEVVAIGDIVDVEVISIERQQGRIGLKRINIKN